MKTILHSENTRGHANHGWLNSYHTFSFAQYHNPERIHFGALRVLNDDVVKGGMGFGMHQHDNMEIISIPLSGDLEHRDSMGNVTVISENEVQIMSAGSGISHSEVNKNRDRDVSFLQIWIFPKETNITPVYDQKKFGVSQTQNQLIEVVSPDGSHGGVKINQDAWMHRGRLTPGTSISYTLKNKANGIYAFIIDGRVSINDIPLDKRDGLAVWETDQCIITAETNADVLLIEVPML